MIHPKSLYYLSATAIGAGVGFLSGLFGKGGSAVTTPLLRVLLGTPRFFALASPLPAALPTTASASWAYRGRDLVDWHAVAVTCLWGIPATTLGSLATDWVGGHTLMLLTALFIAYLGAMLLWRGEREKTDGVARTDRSHRRRLAVIAVGVGFLSGLLANAGGVLYGPLFISWIDMPTKRALATSLIVSCALAIPGTLAHWYLGHIDWALVLALSVATIPMSYLGADLAIKMKSSTLLKIYGTALFLFGLYDFLRTVWR
jgi:uncharacterized membrane protein YfcA